MKDRQVRDVILCRKLIEEIDSVFEFTGGITIEEFLDSSLIKKAVAMSFINIGELAKHMSNAKVIQDALPNREIRGLRNQLAHAYDTVDFAYVWNSIARDLPRLRKRVYDYLAKLEAKPAVMEKIAQQSDKAALIQQARKRGKYS